MSYDCKKCPAYCCTYPQIPVEKKDLNRLAKFKGMSVAKLKRKFFRWSKSEKAFLLKHKKDTIFDTICKFFDRKKRRCTVYEARPDVCREYPHGKKCGYWELLTFERDLQSDKKYIIFAK